MPDISNSPVTESPNAESQIDPKSTVNYRAARAAAIGLGVAIIIALVVMVVGVSQGWGKRESETGASPAKKPPVSMTLASGARILSSDTQPGRLILRVRSQTRDELWVINTDDGSVVLRIEGEAPPQ